MRRERWDGKVAIRRQRLEWKVETGSLGWEHQDENVRTGTLQRGTLRRQRWGGGARTGEATTRTLRQKRCDGEQYDGNVGRMETSRRKRWDGNVKMRKLRQER